MAFSDQFLEDLRARAGLADVIGRRVKLTKKGREHLGLCPFHKEKTPSFTVNEDKGFYHCFGCGEHGSVFDFVMATEGLNFPEAVEKLAGEAGMEVPQDSPEERQRQEQRQTLYDVTEKAARFFQHQLLSPAGKQAHDYLKGRGLTDETIKRFRLGFAPDGRNVLKQALAGDGIEDARMIATGMLIQPDDKNRDNYDRFRGRVMFPITDTRERVIAFGGRILGDGEPKYLNSPETSLFHKGRVLYGLKQASGPARKAGSIIVTEGYTDVIALSQAGLTNVSTFMIAPERWQTTTKFEGILEQPRSHHAMTHNMGKFVEELLKLDRWHVGAYTRMIQKMDAIEEANGSSLLDNTIFTLGCGLGDGSTHQYNDLPLVVAGGGGGRLKLGSHVHCERGTPLANLWLTQMQALGIEQERYADSTGMVNAILA